MDQVGWILLLIVHLSVVSAQTTFTFLQPATGPDRVCVGSNVTLQCVVQRDVSSTITIADSLWSRNGAAVTGTTPNHMAVINSTTGGATDLVITNVPLEDDNTEYTCTATAAPADFTSSVVLRVTGAPSVIPGFTLNPVSTTSFTVSWPTSDPVCGDVTYTITLSSPDGVTGPVTTTDTSYPFTGLLCNTRYNVSVYGTNRIGDGIATSDIITTMTGAAPTISGLSITNTSSISLNVSWTSTSDPVCGDVTYTITLSLSSSPDVIILTNTTNTSSAIFDGVNASISYTVTVFGTNRAGDGELSTEMIGVLPTSEGGASGGGGDSNIGAIVGGVVGGIGAFVIIIIIVVVVVYFVFYREKTEKGDEELNLKEVKGTTGSHAPPSGGAVAPASHTDGPTGEYAVIGQPATVPHQAAPSGVEYAVASKPVGKGKKSKDVPVGPTDEYAVVDRSKKTARPAPPADEYAQVDKSKKNQGITYADLDSLPSSTQRPANTQSGPSATYAQLA